GRYPSVHRAPPVRVFYLVSVGVGGSVNLVLLGRNLSLREHLARRARAVVACGWALLLVSIAVVYWGWNGPKWVSWVSLTVILAGLIAFALLAIYFVRCPICRVRYGQFSPASFASLQKARRFNFCPGCGVTLDSKLPQNGRTIAP